MTQTFTAEARTPAATEPITDRADREGRAPVILQVLPRLEAGGVERGAIDIALALVDAGWGAVVASEGGAMVRELARAGIPHVTLPLASKAPWTIRANIARLAAVIEAHGVDLVHARSRAPGWSALFAAERTGRPFVTTFHGTYGGGALKRRYNAVMTRGRRVIAISDFIREHMLAHYPVDEALIRVIPRGVDLALFDPDRVSQPRMVDLAGRWALPDDRRVILMPGRFSRWKGHRLLIEALSRLGRRDILCVMPGADTGSPRYLAELESLARRRNVSELLRFVDFTRDLPAAYKLSDVVVSASLKPEAFGRTLAEGLAMGRPLVGPDHGGACEIISEGETGWLFHHGNSESLAGALHEALALDARGREEMAAAAMLRARRLFSLDAMGRATLETYVEVLEEAAEHGRYAS